MDNLATRKMRPKEPWSLSTAGQISSGNGELGRCPVSVNRKPRPQETAAQYAVPIIQHAGLAGRDHAGFVQNHTHKPRRPIPGGLTHALPQAQHAAIGMEEFTGLGGIRAQINGQRIITPGGHKTDILSIRLFRHREAKPQQSRLVSKPTGMEHLPGLRPRGRSVAGSTMALASLRRQAWRTLSPIRSWTLGKDQPKLARSMPRR